MVITGIFIAVDQVVQSSPLLQGIVGGEGGGVALVQAAGVSLVKLGAAARLLEQGVGPGVDIRQRGVQLGVRVLLPSSVS